MTLADIGMLALKSAVVGGLGLLLARVAARRAGDRVLMLRSAVVLTLALPVLSVIMPPPILPLNGLVMSQVVIDSPLSSAIR